MKRACFNCDYYNDEESECRRRPPLYIDKERSLWPFVKEECWCGDWIEKSMVGGMEDYVILKIVDNKTGQFAYSNPRLLRAPKPGQVTIWDLRTDFELSNDLSIRVDWPNKISGKDEHTNPNENE